MRLIPPAIVLLLAGGSLMGAAPDFSREILPILSENCFHCHGPDAKGRKADLRLDTKEGALAKNKEGEAAIVPGKPEESSLVARIFTEDRDELMPPPKSNRKLSAKERETLRRWVQEGAPWGGTGPFRLWKNRRFPPKEGPIPWTPSCVPVSNRRGSISSLARTATPSCAAFPWT